MRLDYKGNASPVTSVLVRSGTSSAAPTRATSAITTAAPSPIMLATDFATNAPPLFPIDKALKEKQKAILLPI